jgi:hypothetical protein
MLVRRTLDTWQELWQSIWMCRLSTRLLWMLKVGLRVRSEEKIRNHDQEQAMHRPLLQRIGEAESGVGRDPGQREPPCPIAAAQQEHSTDDCNHFREFDQRVSY